MALAEKGLFFDSRIMTLQDLVSPEYLALNPNGYVPTLVHEEDVLTESRVISEYIEDALPAPALLPTDPLTRAKIRSWTKQIDDSLHLNVFALTFVANFRKYFLARPQYVRERGLPLNFVKRTIALDLAANGAEPGYYLDAVRRFRTLLEHIDRALCQSVWLLADTYSLADADFTPYLRRLEELGFWDLVRDQCPHVERWFGAVIARPSYQSAIRDWETEADRVREAVEMAEARPALVSALAA